MKRFILALIFICSIVFFAYADKELFEFNFGEVSSDRIITHNFKLNRNIQNVIIFCDCLNVRIVSEPGQSPAIIQIQLDPAGYKGDISQEARLVDSEDNLITIRVKAFIE